MKMRFESSVLQSIIPVAGLTLLLSGFMNNQENKSSVPVTGNDASAVVISSASNLVKADAAAILAKPQVPVLCYHQIREFRPTDSKSAKNYIVPPENFREQMKMLHDSGYHAILPDQLVDYLLWNKPLPSRPVMLSFDDADADQYNVALPELNKYGFKAVFFIMTVVLNKPHYLTEDQVRQLAGQGHVIGSHTWDHNNVKKFTSEDWVKQVDKPSRQLERITGKSIKYFAYPFGLWNREAIPELKRRGFVSAFQLSATRDHQDPLYTIRRMIVPGTWTLPVMRAWMKRNFESKVHGPAKSIQG